MRLNELWDWWRNRDADALFYWQRLMGTPDPVLPHPAMQKPPRRGSVPRYAGKPDRGALVPVLIRAHMEHWIMEKRGEQHKAQVGRVRKTRLSLVGQRRKAQAG